MGRKGMKGFIKSAARRPGEEDEEQEEQQAEAAAKPAAPAAAKQQPAASKPAKPAPAAKADETGSGDESGGSGEGEAAGGGPESRGHMLQRHKREMLAHKKALQRSGKKSKDEVAKATAAIEKRHAAELASLDEQARGGGGEAAAAAGPGPAAAAAEAKPEWAKPGGGGASGAAAGAPQSEPDGLGRFLKGLSVDSSQAAAQSRRPSKAQKRREKHAARDAEREQRIAAEKEALGTPERLAEEAELKALLAPLGLGIKEIRADGHCMYRSVEDQLRMTARGGGGEGSGGEDEGEGEGGGGGGVPDYQELRELAAAHLRSHRDEFGPYLVPENESEDPGAYYDRYCDDVEATAAWGGHVELQALSSALQRAITVYGVGMQPQTVGEQFAGRAPGLTLCFLRHAFGLGAHYNSVRKLLFAPAGEEGGEEEGSEGGEEEA